MNILLTLRQPLVPADTGGKVRSLNIFSRLARRANVHAVSFADPVREAAEISQMKALFASYTPVEWTEATKYSPLFYAEVLANQFGSWPYFLAKCRRPELAATVESLLQRHPFDLIFCDFLHTAAPLMHMSLKPKVAFEHNVEFLLRKRKWQVEKNTFRKWVFSNEWRKTERVEGKTCRQFDHVLAVSEDDAASMQSEFGVSSVSVLPAGVDTDFFTPDNRPTIAGRLVFVGSMDWDPNEDAIIWFLREIYPRIRHAAPNVSLAVVGRNPSERLRVAAANQPQVVLTGRVDDVRSYMNESEVVIVPLRVGGGTRIKIPEAMAMAKPVVSTTIGAEGLPFRSGREICIADDPDDFSETVLSLLRDEPLRQTIGTAARKIVVTKHGWDAVVDTLEGVLDHVLEKERSVREGEATPEKVCA